VRQKSDAKILASFFTHHMIPGFVIPNSWQSTSGNERNKKDMLLDIFTLGYLCVQNKITNRYKYFSWFMPPTYQLVDNIKLDEDHPAPVLEGTFIHFILIFYLQELPFLIVHLV
jgi:hypothetical protein